MKHLLPNTSVQYIGGDIVKILIDKNNKRYKNNKIKFIQIDLTKDIFPKSDIMICRDCLFHLSYKDTILLLENFIKSNTPYILTSTHTKKNVIVNRDIQTGDFKLIDLFSSPYNFPSRPLAIIDDYISPYPERKLCLWTRKQISSALKKFNSNKAISLKN